MQPAVIGFVDSLISFKVLSRFNSFLSLLFCIYFIILLIWVFMCVT